MPWGMWDLPGPGTGPVSAAIGRQILNHWTTRKSIDEVLIG